MSDREANSLGRILALVLRHAPEKFNVDMDINGWVNTRELSEAIGNQRRHYHWLRGWHFEAIANADEKGRYQVENGMIRATYGHSIELDLDLPTDDIPEALYYPCESGDVETLLEYGITAGDRKNVHLSRSIQNAMEAGHVRIDRPIILEIDTTRAIADGHTIYRAGTTVFLTDEVPGSTSTRLMKTIQSLSKSSSNGNSKKKSETSLFGAARRAKGQIWLKHGVACLAVVMPGKQGFDLLGCWRL